MEPSSPPYVVELPTGAAGDRRQACSANYDHHGGGEDDDFEFAPLLPQRRRQRSSSARGECRRPRTSAAAITACRGTAVVHAVLTQLPTPVQQRAPRRRQAEVAVAVTVAAKSSAAPASAGAAARRVRWHEMAFGSVRVPAAMDMGEIRRRLQARRRRLADGEAGDEAAAAAGWAPWRLIRSLSCKGIEAVAVAAAAAPVRLV